MNDLVQYVQAAVEAGAIPAPISGESMESYKLRAAHAGAVLGAKWWAEHTAERALIAEAEAAAAAGDAPPQVEQLDLGLRPADG